MTKVSDPPVFDAAEYLDSGVDVAACFPAMLQENDAALAVCRAGRHHPPKRHGQRRQGRQHARKALCKSAQRFDPRRLQGPYQRLHKLK